ncbi:MAG TPA: LLM class flavin-dependent oxidoreductase [Acidimicrobiales bacterium]|nr:LLM class flavin-dependent oxidoreductase [Acidimicrobiales bacterium]
MGITLHWFLPTSGDSRNVVPGVGGHGRPASIDYLAQIARAADHLGFDAVLTPTGTWCEDAWLVTSVLSQHTARLRFLVAFRPGITNPTLAAQQAATFQRLTNGRLLINIVTGGDAFEQRRFGDWLSHDERYARTDEFLKILRGAWSGAPFDFEGWHYKVRGAATMAPPDPIPEVFFGGASSVAEDVAARNVDVYLLWGEPPEMARERIERVREKAAAQDRTIRFGMRLHVITRDTEHEAWAEATRLLDTMDPTLIDAAQQLLKSSESVGQQRMRSLHHGSRDDLEVSPNLWAGIGLVRPGAGTALVGSHEQVAERIFEYHQLGLDEFILSGHPHLEEAYAVGEGVLPRLTRAVAGPSRTESLAAPWGVRHLTATPATVR